MKDSFRRAHAVVVDGIVYVRLGRKHAKLGSENTRGVFRGTQMGQIVERVEAGIAPPRGVG